MELVWTIFYTCAAIIAFFAWLWRRWKVRGSAHWPTAQGTIESYRYEQGRYRVTWFIVYSYSANGEFYSGEFIPKLPVLETVFKSLDSTELMVKRYYPQGITFPLRYKLEEPGWSVPISREPMANPLMAQIGS